MNFGKRINHRITIEASGNMGYTVQIGCALFTFSNTDSLLNDLEAYLKEPEKIEKEYSSTFGCEPPIGAGVTSRPTTQE